MTDRRNVVPPAAPAMRTALTSPGTRSFCGTDLKFTSTERPPAWYIAATTPPAPDQEPVANVPTPPEDYEADIPGTGKVDIVGPVCESGDFLAKGRNLPPLQHADLLAVFSAGAYGMAMSSTLGERKSPKKTLRRLVEFRGIDRGTVQQYRNRIRHPRGMEFHPMVKSSPTQRRRVVPYRRHGSNRSPARSGDREPCAASTRP